ncbi:MAG: hypothetical protein O8C61_00280 [Candidatus Methanoperedens sp.]|nr:hypothetical protein [Candidatus Methanoperedens sp.]
MKEKQASYEIERQEAKRDIFQAGGDIKINKNVFQIINPSPEAIERLAKIVDLPVEVPSVNASGMTKSASTEGSRSLQEIEEIQKNVDDILGLIDEKGNPQVNEFQTGDVRISRTELLAKKVLLLEWEAFIYPNNPEAILKLKEALGICREIIKLNPANIDVLLHIAMLLIYVTPDDKSDEEKVLHDIQKLLRAPKNDTEMFQLASANFMLAVHDREHIDFDLLMKARAIFEKLGRMDMLQNCDLYLQTRPVSPVTAQGFQPVGRWQIQISDGSTMFLNLNPDGTFQAAQQKLGLNVQGIGQWGFNPYNQMLQMQGLLNGYQPFMFGIMIQGQQNNGYYGVGTDGASYFIVRV